MKNSLEYINSLTKEQKDVLFKRLAEGFEKWFMEKMKRDEEQFYKFLKEWKI